jgi:short-subunit dehydrogenase
MMKLQKGKRALVTGASSGIGWEFAEALAARGLDLALVARSGDKLKELAEKLSRDHGVKVDVFVADLSQPGAAQKVWTESEKRGWSVDLLINNAGFGKWGEFLDFDLGVYGEMLRLNVQALVELCHLFLPSLLKNHGLGIINVGSTGSLVPVPFAGVYGATKAFVISFTDALYGEYASRGPHFMTLCPGGTATGFAEVANAEAARRRGPSGASPRVVVADALKAFEKGKTYVVTTRDNYFNTALMPRLLPRRVMANLVAAVFRRVVGK